MEEEKEEEEGRRCENQVMEEKEKLTNGTKVRRRERIQGGEHLCVWDRTRSILK